MTTLITQLQDANAAGVFAINDADARELFRIASNTGLNVCRIDLSQASNESSLFELIADALYFPDWFDENWDALSDSLSDLSWSDADGHVLVLVGLDNLREQDAESYTTLLEVLHEACTVWRDDDAPFWALIDSDDAELTPLQR